MADGYQMIAQALKDYGEQSGWNDRNRLAPVDWKATFSKLLGLNKNNPNDTIQAQEGTITEPKQTISATDKNTLQSVGVNAPGIDNALTMDTQTKNMIQSSGITVPEVTGSFNPTSSQIVSLKKESPGETPQYSPDNSFLKYDPTGKELFTRKESPELMALKQGWETNKRKNDLTEKMAQAEYDRLVQKQTPATYDAQTVSNFASGLDGRNPYKKALANISANTPADQVQKLIAEAGDYQNYLLDYDKPSGSGSQAKEKTFIDKMNTAYDDFRMGSSKYYSEQSKPVPDVTSWIRTTYGEEAARKYKAEATGDAGQLNVPTTASKRGTSLGYIKNTQFSEPDWWKADELVKSKKSFNKAFSQAMKDPSASESLIYALAARYNRINKTNLTPQQLYSKFGTPNGGDKVANR